AVWDPAGDPPPHRGGAGDAILPGDDPAVVEACRNVVAIGRAVDVVLDILFAGPHDLHRSVDLFGDADGRRHHVGLETAAKAAADQLIVHDNLVDRQSGRLGGR